MCFGGPSTNASDQARRDEQARITAIQRTQGAVNQVFDSPQRAADIGDYVKATRDFLGRDLDEQKNVADRQLRFTLARSGQVGGSLNVDKQAQFGRDYTKGVLAVDQKARGAGADLEAQDQDARARLITLATSGLDATTAAQQSAAAMRSSLEAGKATSQAQGLGDIFGSLSKFYEDRKSEQARRKGIADSGISYYQANPNLTPNYGFR